MRKTILFLSLNVFCLLTCGHNAQSQEGTQVRPINRDVKLERAISERYDRVTSLLQPTAKKKLAIASRILLTEVLKSPEPTNLEKILRSEVKHRFVGLSAAQTDLLIFWALADIAQYATQRLDGWDKKAKLEPAVDKIKNDSDSMSEMGEMESLRLQMAMDRRSKMMSTLSNILKKISDTADQIIQNIK